MRAVRLHVSDDQGVVLADVAQAGRADFMLSVDLLSGTVVVDLYGHYQAFVDAGAAAPYRGHDCACRTYVKFGQCMQDRRELLVLIQPA